MRAAFIVGAVGLVGFGLWYHHRHAEPSAAQVEPLVRDYLEQEPCAQGTLIVRQLDSISVGRYVDQFGGWPIYANHVEECREGASSFTNDSSHDAERQVAVAFARRSSTGRLELFVPELFAQGQRAMSDAFQKAFDSVQIKK